MSCCGSFESYLAVSICKRHATCTLTFMDCTVEFYFSANTDDPVVIENRNAYDCPPSNIYWIIAGVLVGAILLLGLLALIIVKICLVVLVSGISSEYQNVHVIVKRDVPL